MTTVRDLIRQKGSEIVSVRPGDTVFAALEVMAERNVGAVMVMGEDGELVGVLSERDYARKVVLNGRSSTTTAVREIMSSPVITIGPDQTVEDAMRVMTTHRIRHLPVVRGAALLGVVSIGDLVKSVIEEQRHTIEDLRSYIQG